MSIEAVVREANGSRARRKPFELAASTGQRVHRIQQDLGRQTPRVKAREMVPILGIVSIGLGAQLVGGAAGQGAHQFLQVEPTGHKVGGQGIEQFWITRRIGVAHVILGIDQASPKEMLPVAIDQRLGKPGVLGRGHPIRQEHPGIIVDTHVKGRLSQGGGLHGLAILFIGRLSLTTTVNDDLFAGLHTRLVGDLREGRPKAPVVGLTPLFIRMMVALSTLHSLAEE